MLYMQYNQHNDAVASGYIKKNETYPQNKFCVGKSFLLPFEITYSVGGFEYGSIRNITNKCWIGDGCLCCFCLQGFGNEKDGV